MQQPAARTVRHCRYAWKNSMKRSRTRSGIRMPHRPSCRLRGRDRDAFLLAGACNIADRGALHVAFPAQVVEFGSPVHGAAVVPHHEIAHAPAMRVDELALGRVRHELVDQSATLGIGHAEDTTRM